MVPFRTRKKTDAILTALEWLIVIAISAVAIVSLAYAYSARAQDEPVLGFGLELSVTQGNMSPDTLRAAIVEEASSLRYCYGKETSRSPDLAGQVKIDLTINSAENMVAVETASSELHNPILENCLRSRLQRSLERLDTNGTIRATITLTFGPQFEQPVYEPPSDRSVPPPAPPPTPIPVAPIRDIYADGEDDKDN